MNSEFFSSLADLEKEYGIPQEYMLEKTKEALIKACQKEYNGRDNEGQPSEAVIRVAVDEAKKDIPCSLRKDVVETVTDPVTQISVADAREYNKRMTAGKVLEIEIKTKNLRRLSAGAAKSVIIQAIREAQKENSRREFENKREEIITATVTRVWDDTGDVEVDTDNGRLKLAEADQIPGEYLDVGMKVKIYFSEITRRGGMADIKISRTAPGFIRGLFRLEVPEVADGTVVVRNVAREAGSRSKVSVYTEDESIDPVGTCVGPHGMRIGNILDNLAGEKVDIVRYSDDKAEYIKSALAPAEVIDVEMLDEKISRVIVSPDQLSLAIGLSGQNARLAAKLTGCKIDIKTE